MAIRSRKGSVYKGKNKTKHKEREKTPSTSSVGNQSTTSSTGEAFVGKRGHGKPAGSSPERKMKRKSTTGSIKKLPSQNGKGKEAANNNLPSGPWCPNLTTALKCLISARLCSAFWSNISDCDETFNYWEPTHFLIYNSGFQTWEYSPQYAIRSYAYLLLYALPAWIYAHILPTNKVLVFYSVRCMIAVACALSEFYLYRGVTRTFGPIVARFILLFSLLSTGMFISSTAFLPSSFSMYMTAIMFASWLHGHVKIVILSAGVSALVGWPFSAAIGFPIAVDILIRGKRMSFIKWCAIIGASISVLLIAIDSYYYGKLVFAPLNIVLYNVFSKHGPNLYGTEPWQFYFINLFLNFNVVFIASLASPLILLICALIRGKKLVSSKHLVCMASLFIWYLIFFVQPHKEERFIFPVYPLICLTAAFSVDLVQRLLNSLIPKLHSFISTATLIACTLFTILSVSRGLALYKGYSAPIEVYMELSHIHHGQNFSRLISPSHPINVCVGKEWYRFPNSFFLPDSKRWTLNFIESEFRGQLPKHYEESPNATSIIPSHMNDLNMEEPSRYVPVASCHFLVDTAIDPPIDHEAEGAKDIWRESREPNYSKDIENWEVIKSRPFLDATHSPTIFRAFYIPFITERKCSYIDYNLLKNKHLQIKIDDPSAAEQLPIHPTEPDSSAPATNPSYLAQQNAQPNRVGSDFNAMD